MAIFCTIEINFPFYCAVARCPMPRQTGNEIIQNAGIFGHLRLQIYSSDHENDT